MIIIVPFLSYYFYLSPPPLLLSFSPLLPFTLFTPFIPPSSSHPFHPFPPSRHFISPSPFPVHVQVIYCDDSMLVSREVSEKIGVSDLYSLWKKVGLTQWIKY